MPDDPSNAQPGDPAQAFEDLRAEVSVLRKAVEALPAALHDNRPPDYAQDLAVLGKGLDEIGGQFETIQKSPVLRMTPEQQGQSIANAGSALIRGAAQALDRATQEVERERSHLAAMIGEARTQDRQLIGLCWAAGIALAVGLILSPFLAAMLPFGLNARVAALVMRDDRWAAGETLMQASDPESWNGMVAAANLVGSNRAAIDKCSMAAAKSKHDERCTIIVKVAGS